MKFSCLNKRLKKPKRVVVLGSTGIISINLQKKLKLQNIKCIALGRKQIDLKKKKSVLYLKKKINNYDTVVFISAEAPVKNIKMKLNNLKICKNICSGLKNKILEQLIYISSDAVYSDVKNKITEKSETKPNSLHGKMHLQRENILKSKFKKILCILRPTLIYGPKDSHNGYGPNQFLDLCKKKKNIILFGKGEEKRDHIYIDEVVALISLCIQRKAKGVLNLVTGKVTSFKKIAKIIKKISNNIKPIYETKRTGPMPHNGFRPFDNKLLKKNFNNFKFKNIEDNIKKYYLKTI